MRRSRRPGVGSYLAIGAIAVGGLWFAVSGGSGGDPDRGRAARAPAFVPGELLVRFKDAAAEGERTRVRSLVGGRRLRRLGRALEQLKLDDGRSTQQALERLRRDPAVEYAEPNYLYHVDNLPDDPLFPELFGLRNTGQTGGTPGADIHAEEAWDLTTGSREVVIGVIDSGVDYNHPDLAPNIWINPDEIPQNGIDDDDNGYVDDVRGWDFVNDDNDPFDDQGHGTHVAGTIGAAGDNGLGVTGVAWKVRLVPLKFISAFGSGTTADAVAAVEYATAIGADATNNSWGGGAYSLALDEAIQAAAEAGVVFVASAGNQGLNTDLLPHYPSSYSAPNVISVAAVNHDDVRPVFSNVGPRSVDLGAPGVSVLSTTPGGTYGLNTGTSMAAPHVTGAVALIRSLAPEIGVVEIRQLLMDHVDPTPTLGPLIASGGRLNVARSFAARDQLEPGAVRQLTSVGSTSNAIELSWIATGDDGDDGTATTYELRFAPWPIDESNFALASRAWQTPRPAPSGSAESFELTGLASGSDYHVALRAVDEWGNRGPLALALPAATLPPPVFASSPVRFDLTLFSGERASRTIDLTNAGPGTLDWQVDSADLSWIGLSPQSGRLLSGETTLVALEIDTRDLAPGVHQVTVEIGSNDPLRPLVPHPVTVEVIGAPAIEVEPSAVDAGSVIVGASTNVVLTVRNFGSEPLTVDATPGGTTELTVTPSQLELAPGEQRTLDLRWSPTVAGPFDAVLTLATNVPGVPLLVVPVHGDAAPAPAIAIEPSALGETLLAGTSSVRTLRIHNPGDGPLVVDFRFEPGDDPGPSLVSPVVNGGFESGDFTGWEATTNNLFTRGPWIVAGPGVGSFENSQPIEGSFDALNAFEGQAGLRFDLFQSLAIPVGATRAELGYFDRIQWNDFGAPGEIERFYRATIEDDHGQRLDTIVEREILFDGTGYTDLGWQRRSIDLAHHAGRTVRLHIREGIQQSLTGLAQIEFDDFRMELEGFPAWFRPQPKRVTVAPGETVDVELVFDAAGLLSAAFDGRIRLETNVPSTPRLFVDIDLSVYGVPRMTLRGRPFVVESTRTFSTAGATTEHLLSLAAPASGGGLLQLVVEADLGQAGESALLRVEGVELGSIGNTGGDCAPATAEFAVDAERLAAIAADGVLEATVTNTPSVAVICAANRHRLRLTYDTPAETVDFGTRFVGETVELPILIENSGSAPLELTSITSDRPAYTLSAASAQLPVGATMSLAVRFTAGVAGHFDGTLTIVGNDPERPRFDVALTATAIDPPTIELEPAALDERLPVGGATERVLRLTNHGDAPLDYSIDLSSAGESFVELVPSGGSVAADATADLLVRLDAVGLAPASYDATLTVRAQLESIPAVVVPLRLTVDSAPDIEVHGPSIR
ncbi:MAG TPA: S8 family serine peptidase, partial [Candidatus Polarisedimenticolaceae bacterium]|nr:S8 family serine peptidase [Candidatus Polarisedimenticolaceae bacterium]